MRRVRQSAVVLAAALCVAGCATVPPAMPAGGRAPDPERLTQWVAKGRIALAAQGEGGSGSFVWQQRSDRTELTVRGPLGAGGLHVVSDGRLFEVEDAQGRALDGAAARTALEQRLGVNLPLGELRFWLLGLPSPDTPHAVATGTVGGNAFTQDGWDVSYDEYRSAGPWSLPAKLTARTLDVRVRLVIDDWQVPAP